MSALPNPEVPQNQQVDPVTRFITNYAKAMTAAEISQVHTNTDGWRNLYQQHARAVMDARRNLSEEMEALAEQLERGTLSEDGEKAIGEVKKAATELRTANHYWELQTVDPVQQPVRVCEAMLINAMGEARRIAADSPMLNIGLTELMRQAVAKSARVSWDAELGTVIITEAVDPDTGEVL